MKAVTVIPGQSGSLKVCDVADPTPEAEELLVEGIAIGVCGTDKEIVSGQYGWPPSGSDRLILGHESLGRVRKAPDGSGFSVGDLVAGVVRRPDPVPCGACGHGEFDMCRNGRYQERGIKELPGYGSQLWCVPPDYAVRLAPELGRLGVLMEPTSVVAKAWEQVDRIGERSWFEPRTVLVTGAGPIGLLAALIGVQRGLDTHVLDQVSDGPKPPLVRDLGATYHSEDIDTVAGHLQPDVIIEATGAGSVVFAALRNTATYGIICLTGVSPAGRRISVDAGSMNRDMVLENDVVVGSVSANQRHYRQAADVLRHADARWLERLITRSVPLDKAADAFDPHDDDVKVIIEIGSLRG